MKRFGAVAAAVFVLLVVASSARAGTYDVLACDGAPGSANNSWSTFTTGSHMRASAACPTNGAAERGIWVSNAPGALSAGFDEAAWAQFWAPSGAKVVSLTYTGGFLSVGSRGFSADLVDPGIGLRIFGCEATASNCRMTTGTPQTISAGSVGGISLIAHCTFGGGCSSGAVPVYDTSFGYAAGAVQLRSASVRVSDSTLPSTSVVGGDLLSGWVRGQRTVSYSATDNVGIRVARAYVDGVERASDSLTCDFTRPAPCPDVSARAMTIDTTQVADGAHTLRVDSVDAAGNVGSATRTIQVDNHAPSAPVGAAVSPAGWSSTNRFDVSWTNPGGQGAPIVKARWLLCAAGGTSDCTTGSAAGTDINSVSGLTVPAAGAWDLTVWLEDAVGNANVANAAPVTLRLADPAGAAPRVTPPSGWVRSGSVSVGLDGAVAGDQGYSVSTDGADPDGSADVSVGGLWTLPNAPEGVSVLKARVISRNGTLGAVTRSLLRVDRTAPSLKLLGAGDPATPHPGPITVTIDAVDELSGMASAEEGQPVTSGAYVAYTLDGGAEMMAAGDEASVGVSAEGWHTLRYWAVDVAGNRVEPAERRMLVRPPPINITDPDPFSATSANAPATFHAAASFGSACPAITTLVADRNATTAESDSSTAQATDLLRLDAAAASRRNGLLGFSLPSAPGCALVSARLRVSLATASPPVRLSACRAGGAWSEALVTWATQPGCVGSPASALITASGPVEIDLTEQIRAIYRTGDNGLLLRSLDGAAALAARTNSDPEKRPQLIVAFEQ